MTLTGPDVVKILAYGVVGLGFLLALLAHNLLVSEGKKDTPSQEMLRAIRTYMVFSIILCIIGLGSQFVNLGGLWINRQAVIVQIPPARVYSAHLADVRRLQGDTFGARGYILGDHLEGSAVDLLNSTDLPGVFIRADGVPTGQKIDFVLTSALPIPPGKTLKIGVAKREAEIDLAINYAAALSTLTKADPAALTQGDQDKVLTLSGTNFLPGATQVLITPTDGVTVTSVDVKSSTSLEAKVTVTATASPTSRQVTVVTPGGSSSGVPLTISKK